MKSFRLEISKTRIFAFILITAYLPFIYPADIDSREFLSLKSVFATGGRISGDPLAAPGGGILFFSEDRYLYSFDSSGAFLSRKKIKNSFSPFHAQGIDRIIYKYFRDNSLKAVNSSGQILWSVKINSTLLYAPFISSSGDIITAEDDGILSSYSYSGRKRWELDLKNSPVTNSSKAAMSCIPCAGLSGVIYAGMSDGNIVSLNSSGKIIKWIKNTENSITALFSSGRKLYASDTKGRLLVYNKDLDLQKSLKLKSPVLSIRASRNLLAVIHRNGSASVYDDEMKLLRSFGSSMKITGEPLIADRNVYFLAGKGFVAWFDSLSGISGEASIPLKAVNGIREVKDKYPHHSFLYKEGAILAAGGEDWNIYFFYSLLLSDADTGMAYLFSGDDTEKSVIKPDTKYLIYINELSLSEDAGAREKAMKLAGNALLSGITAGDEEYLIQMIRRSALKERESASVKSMAAEIIGKIGTHDALDLLREMLEKETDPFAASIEIKELGKAGSDYDGRSTRVIITAYNRFSGYRGIDENLIESFREIKDYNGYFSSEEGKTLLFKMLEQNRNRDLQLKIIDLLKYMEQ